MENEPRLELFFTSVAKLYILCKCSLYTEFGYIKIDTGATEVTCPKCKQKYLAQLTVIDIDNEE